MDRHALSTRIACFMACGFLNGLRNVRRFPRRRRSCRLLTYFAGGKGYSWPSFGLLGEKLHCSRRHVMRLVQELSTHGLITVTNVRNPERGHCANYYRFLWHPWMQTERDAKFVLAAVEGEPVDFLEESAPRIARQIPLVTLRSLAPW